MSHEIMTDIQGAFSVTKRLLYCGMYLKADILARLRINLRRARICDTYLNFELFASIPVFPMATICTSTYL